MKIFGTEISLTVIGKCQARMWRGDSFDAREIELLAVGLGIVNSNAKPVAYRLADRLIQRARKAGTIARLGRRWVKVKASTE